MNPEEARKLIAKALDTDWKSERNHGIALSLIAHLEAVLADVERLDWMQSRSVPESGLTWLEIGPWTNDQTLRSYIDAARGKP